MVHGLDLYGTKGTAGVDAVKKRYNRTERTAMMLYLRRIYGCCRNVDSDLLVTSLDQNNLGRATTAGYVARVNRHERSDDV